LEEGYSVLELAEAVREAAKKKGLNLEVEHVTNTRKELEQHHYKVEANHLLRLGFKPTRTLKQELGLMLDELILFKR
jgi:UDP-sulfoquinovose synthase